MIRVQLDVTVEQVYKEGKPDGIRLRDQDTGDVVILRPEGVINLVEFLESLVL